MRKKNPTKTMKPFVQFLINYAVPILFIIIIAFAVPLSGVSGDYIIRELMTRIFRNSFLVLSLLIPVMAGMGMNFSIVIGAMAAQITLLFVTDWHIVGLPAIFFAILISTPIAIFLGYFAGIVLNRAKGREMVTGFMLSFFMNGIYQLFVLFTTGSIIPISDSSLLLPRGYGIRNTINLIGIRQSLDELIPIKIGTILIPIATLLVIATLCLFIIWFRKTKLGQVIRIVGYDNDIAQTLGINVGRIRILSIIISTVLACYGHIIFLQNMGTVNTYSSHEQIGVFAIAALLVGGASVDKANIHHVFIGIILFHTMFLVSPLAGKNLMGQAELGEYFRVFVSYGVIAFSLGMYAWRKRVEIENERKEVMDHRKLFLQSSDITGGNKS